MNSLITFEDKVSNPEFEAMFEGLPANTYVSAGDINQIKTAIQTLENQADPESPTNEIVLSFSVDNNMHLQMQQSNNSNLDFSISEHGHLILN